MVKVDGQSALELFTHGDLERVRSMNLYQEALQGAAAAHLNGQTLHCMSHGSDVIFNLDYSSVIRNSSDYLPGWDHKGHQQHIVRNTFNALYFSLFGIPDWDMFQTGHLHSEFHAAARALSGGPIYVSDKPGMQDFELVERLVCFDKGAAEALRCPQPALPSPESLYKDPCHSGEAVKVFNHINGIGLLGIFHCSDTREALATRIAATDLPVLDPEFTYAVWLVRSEKLHLLKPGENLTLHLETMGYELAVFSEVKDGCAPLGLIDKFNPPAGLCGIVNEKPFLRVQCRDGGRLGFYCRSAPETVKLDNHPVPFIHDTESGMLIVRSEKREPHHCHITLPT
jgi:raffinose synthase